jgi:hypothetical protein
MCSVNVDVAKEMNDFVNDSSLKVGVNMERMEKVLK